MTRCVRVVVAASVLLGLLCRPALALRTAGGGGGTAGPPPAAPTEDRAPAPSPGAVGPSPPPGEWVWPVTGAVLRAFRAPEDPFGPGHRGIDVAAPVGAEVLAPADGVVAFAGSVAGDLFVTIDHGGGLRSTSSWVSEVLVAEGEPVSAGRPVARSGPGHPGSSVPHVHFGIRLDGAYVDPLEYLGPPSVVGLIHLARLEDAP